MLLLLMMLLHQIDSDVTFVGDYDGNWIVIGSASANDILIKDGGLFTAKMTFADR